MSSFDYYLFVIGGNSGGIRAARVPASLVHRRTGDQYVPLGLSRK